MARQCQAKWMSSLTAALSQQGVYQSPWPELSASLQGMDDLGADDCRYFLSTRGELGLVELRFVPIDGDAENFAQNSSAVDALRAIVAQAKARHPGVQIGLTGLPVMENDEMRVSQSAMTVITFLSLGGIFLVLVAGFGGLRHSVLTLVALILGTVWTVGFTTMTVGYLNILSIAFGSILMGLGINYGIYYAARYLQLCETSESTAEALVKAAASVGPSITIGSLTAACSFFTMAFTDFKGVSQLGIIAGGGIMLCWLAAMTVLPALIMLFDAHSFGRRPSAPLDIYSGLRPLYLKPRLTLVLTVAVTAALATGIGKLWYDDNLLNLQAIGLESVELEHKLLTETNQSAWFALSVANDPAEALRRKAAFDRLPTVERVEELASLFPANEEQNRPVIERIYAPLDGLAGRAAADSPAVAGAIGPIALRHGPGSAGRPQDGQAAAMAQLGQLLASLPPAGIGPPGGRFPAARCRRSARPAPRLLQAAANPRAAHPERPARQPGHSVHRPQRQVPDEDLQQEGHLEPCRPRAVRAGHPQRRSRRHRQSVASLRGLAAHEAQLSAGGRLCPDRHHGGAHHRVPQPALSLAGHVAAGGGSAANVRPDGLLEHSAQFGQYDRAAADSRAGGGKRHPHRQRLPPPHRPLPSHEHRHDHRGDHQLADHDGRLRGLDGRQPPRAAKPGTRAHHRHELLPAGRAGAAQPAGVVVQRHKEQPGDELEEGPAAIVPVSVRDLQESTWAPQPHFMPIRRTSGEEVELRS